MVTTQKYNFLDYEVVELKDDTVCYWNGRAWVLGTLILTNFQLIFLPAKVSSYVNLKKKKKFNLKKK
jgi:hypothetical protein